MRFWDTSALVPLLSDEPLTDVTYSLLRQDPDVTVAFITPLELTSAIVRRAGVNDDLLERAYVRFGILEDIWKVVDDYATVLADARRLAAAHGLRSGDAIQLACARIASGGVPTKMAIVTNDFDLKLAARAEGSPTLP